MTSAKSKRPAIKGVIVYPRGKKFAYNVDLGPDELTAKSPGLATKTVKNVHRMLHRALADAVAWRYLEYNPADTPHSPARNGQADPLAAARPGPQNNSAWLKIAITDRNVGMWVLAATTGMRRSELAGAERALLDLDNAILELGDTRVVVDGKAEDSDGKTASARRTISLDPLTVTYLGRHLAMLEEERKAFGTAYQDHGKLICHPDGTPLHPDTITRRFNKLVDQAGVPRIRLHDVRHTYATLSFDAGIDPKSSATASATPTWPTPWPFTPTARQGGTKLLPKRWLPSYSARIGMRHQAQMVLLRSRPVSLYLANDILTADR